MSMRSLKNSPRLGIFCVLAAGVLWGSMGVFVRFLGNAGLAAPDITQLRVTVGLLTVAAYLLIFRRDLLRVRLRDLWCFFGTGVVSLLFFSTCYFKAMEYVSLSTAAILLYTAPVFVMLMSLLLFRERMTPAKLSALVLSLAGCVLVSGIGGGMDSPAGIAFGLASGFFYALYSIFSRYAIRRGYTSLTVVLYTFLFCAVGCIPLTNWRSVGQVLCSGAANVWLCVALGVVTGFLPYVLYAKGLERMESSKAAIIASVEPVVGTLFGVLLFHEPLTLLGALGVLLVLSAILLLSLPQRFGGGREE